MSTRSQKTAILSLILAVAASRGVGGCSSEPGSKAPPASEAKAQPDSGVNGSSRPEASPASLELRTTAFKPGGDIPKKFTCAGPDTSPALDWNDPPAGTRSLVLVMYDPDAPAGTWVHWVVYDLPPSTRQLPEGVPKDGAVPGGGRQGVNDFEKTGYGGPCPPPGKPHRYYFKLYALDKQLGLDRATKHDVEQAMQGHVLAEGDLLGRFGR